MRAPFTAVLLALGLVPAFVASWGTATVILSLVAVGCVPRAAGERRADHALAALREPVAGTATVLRRTGATADPPTRSRWPNRSPATSYGPAPATSCPPTYDCRAPAG
ncbi:hypothetical protein BFF78_10765 [Streptomyces fodineus]|uniref:Uncharacterized protein n=1 Tax=Streptomyces fodineus TaxID=1904616 RepID=A0A1D7Y7C2_9ACTN|nr:hypothetical protein BFF78_10765 [Streptomyces fodineus]